MLLYIHIHSLILSFTVGRPDDSYLQDIADTGADSNALFDRSKELQSLLNDDNEEGSGVSPGKGKGKGKGKSKGKGNRKSKGRGKGKGKGKGKKGKGGRRKKNRNDALADYLEDAHNVESMWNTNFNMVSGGDYILRVYVRFPSTFSLLRF